MKRSKLLLSTSVIFILLTLYIKYSCARSYKEIHHLLTDDEREEIFGHPLLENVPEYDVSHPIQVDAAGRFFSRDLANGNTRRKRDINNAGVKEPVFFKLSAFGRDFHLNVTINDELFSPHFEIEIRGSDSSEFHDDIDHCHYLGQLISAKEKGSKVAVSNCDGLKGMIRTPQEVLMVHPLPDRLKLGKNNTRAHLIHRRSLAPVHAQTLEEALREEKRSDSWCGVEGGSAVQQSDEGESDTNFVRSSTTTVKGTIESLIVVENTMTKFRGVPYIKNYVPTIVNVAHGLLADKSLGIKYVIHKLLILEKDMPGLVISSHAESTLNSFCEWTHGQNVDDDNDARHFDHAALISKFDFCRNKQPNAGDCGSVLGLAGLGGMCEEYSSCTLNKDTGLGTAFTLAHETAHNLGAEHDGEGNTCEGGVHIMAAGASGKPTAFDWSKCSINYVKKFLQKPDAKCLNDDAKNNVKIPEGKPGRLYDGNAQCVLMYGAGSKVCDMPDLKKDMCAKLYCEKPDGFCDTNQEPAAEGTICADNKECQSGHCVTVKPEDKTPTKRPNKSTKRPNKPTERPNKPTERPNKPTDWSTDWPTDWSTDWSTEFGDEYYTEPSTQSARSFSDDSDLPELFREIYEVNNELREADERSEDAEIPETKRMTRWEVGVWTDCTKSCNDGEHGVRSREVFCVEDSEGVELELKDSECEGPKPVTHEACGTQSCPAEWNTIHEGPCSTSCGPGVRQLKVECVKTNSSGETETVDAKECQGEMMPPNHVACNVENPCENEMEVEE